MHIDDLFHAHPYHPTDLVLRGFVPQQRPFEQTLAVFFAATGVALAAGWKLSGSHKHLVTKERLLVCWFLCTGLIHLIVEGAVVLNAEFYKDTSRNILSEIWKEYAKADSRYATRDDFVISMEAVTAFVEGPGCFLIVWALCARKAWRYVAVVLVSLGQLYGDVLYFGTCLHGGVDRHTRPEFIYFWFYFVIINGVWIVIPFACIVWAAKRINAAVAKADGKAPAKKRRD
ncbi:MAG: Emopamil-binding protein [Monoraphidium minutum]|nr:MAG: Emopamil-binding protein [Monoraphidium minutum]